MTVAALPLAALLLQQTGPPDALLYKTPAGVPCQVIQLRMDDLRVRVSVVTAQGFPTHAESFASMVARSHATIAFSGTFASETTLRPIGDIVVDGNVLYRGDMGTALAIGRDNRAIIRRVNRDRDEDWSQYDTVLACGPTLVMNGQADVLTDEEGFHDPHVLGSATRMGVGLTADRRLLLVHAMKSLTLQQFANVMMALGCKDAMNLDAGGSVAMYYRGKTLVKPGRHLTNALVVYVDSKPREN